MKYVKIFTSSFLLSSLILNDLWKLWHQPKSNLEQDLPANTCFFLNENIHTVILIFLTGLEFRDASAISWLISKILAMNGTTNESPCCVEAIALI